MASSASDSDGTRQLTSPATPIGSRLVANSVNPRAASSSATTSAALASSRCSQLSSTTSICRSATKRVSVSIVERPGWSGSPKRAGRGDRHQIGVGDRRQIHIPDPVAELAGQLARDLDRQPGFARPAGTGQGHQPVLAQQLAHLGQLRVTAHETGQLHRKMLGGNGFGYAQRRELVDHIGMA